MEDSPAWTKRVPVYGYKERSVCNVCSTDITGNVSAHAKAHMLAGVFFTTKVFWISRFNFFGFHVLGKDATPSRFLTFRSAHHEGFLEPPALSAELDKAPMVHDAVYRCRGEVRATMSPGLVASLDAMDKPDRQALLKVLRNVSADCGYEATVKAMEVLSGKPGIPSEADVALAASDASHFRCNRLCNEKKSLYNRCKRFSEKEASMKESRTLEFKSEVTRGFLKTVSAFANFGKGSILFGVDDDGRVVGLDDPASSCLDIENRINDSFDPRPSFKLKVNEDRTVELVVEEGHDKPYLCGGKAYRRSDTSTVEVDKLELRRLVLEGQNLDFDEVPCRIGELSFTRLEAMLKESVGIASLSEDSLRTLGLLGKDGYNNAAAILADTSPFPGVDIAVFGEDEDIILDRAQVSDKSVLDSLAAAMEIYESRCCYEKIDGALREKVETVPRKAFRETVANALAHRAWDVPAPVRISIKPSKVEVLSPGGLVPEMAVESYLDGRYSMLRNPTLAEVFFRLGIIEKFGTGIARIKRSYEGTDRKPTFEVESDFICVTLPVLDQASPLGGDELLVFSKMPRHQLLSRADIDRLTGFEKTKTIRILNSLEAKGLIEAIGKARARKYSRL